MLPPRPELDADRRSWRALSVASSRLALTVLRRAAQRPLRAFPDRAERLFFEDALDDVIKDAKASFPTLMAPAWSSARFTTMEELDRDMGALRKRYQIASFVKEHLEKNLDKLAEDLKSSEEHPLESILAPTLPPALGAPVRDDAWMIPPRNAHWEFWLPLDCRRSTLDDEAPDTAAPGDQALVRFIRAAKRRRPAV